MESATILAAGAGAAAMLLLVAVALLVTRRRRSRADLERMLLAAQQETDDLRHRLDELTGGRPGGPVHREELSSGTPPAREPAEFVITHVGETGLETAPDREGLAVPDRLVLSATLGEPLIKVAAFTHGVRRAFSAESRNRIWFEVRRETRASRRRRRQLRKRLEREHRATLRSTEDLVVEESA